jgi:hypothetical protein
MMISGKKNPQNLATLACFFHKNPLCELQWIFFGQVNENFPTKKA